MVSILTNQVAIMLLLILAGMLCYKLHLFTDRGVKELSGIVLQVVNPIVILLAYHRELELRLVQNLGWTFLLSAVAMGAGIGLATLLIRNKPGRETAVERLSAVYSNCGFMGIPLVKALLGYEGVFYLTAFLTVFNLLIWTHGIMSVTGSRDPRSLLHVLRSPAILAIPLGMILFFGRITLPSFLAETLEQIAGMNTPLAMLVAGATIAQGSLKQALLQRRVYLIAGYKLLLMPLLTIGMFFALPLDPAVFTTVVLSMAAPTAITCTLFAVQNDKNAEYASQIFAISTVFSLLTLPVVGVLLEAIEK